MSDARVGFLPWPEPAGRAQVTDRAMLRLMVGASTVIERLTA